MKKVKEENNLVLFTEKDSKDVPTNEETMTQLLAVYKNLDDAALRGMRTILMEESVMRLESALSVMQLEAQKAREENEKLKKAFKDHKEEVMISFEKTEVAFHEHEQKLGEHDVKIEQLKDEILLNSKEKGQLQRTINRRAYQVLDNPTYYNYFKESNGQAVKEVVRKVYPRLHNNIKKHFEVGSYQDIQRVQFEEALRYVNNWYPNIR